MKNFIDSYRKNTICTTMALGKFIMLLSLMLCFSFTIEAKPAKHKLERKKLISSAEFLFRDMIDSTNNRVVFERHFVGSDGLGMIRGKGYFKWGKQKAIVVFINGRGEFIEKYDVLFTSLHEFPLQEAPAEQTLADMPVHFVTMDTAGQGESVAGRVPGHVLDYNYLLEDVLRLYRTLHYAKRAGLPVILMGHSMGGLIATRFAQEYPHLVDGLILSSPLYGLSSPTGNPEDLVLLANAYAQPHPYGFDMADRCALSPQVSLETLATLPVCLTDSNCSACFMNPELEGCDALPFSLETLQSAWSFLNSDESIGCPTEHDTKSECTLGDPGFGGTTTDAQYCEFGYSHPNTIGGPTFGWLLETINTATEAQMYMGNLNMPVLMLSSPLDPIVDTDKHEEACEQMADCTLQSYDPTPEYIFLHELLAESRRDLVINDIRQFIVGFYANDND